MTSKSRKKNGAGGNRSTQASTRVTRAQKAAATLIDPSLSLDTQGGQQQGAGGELLQAQGASTAVPSRPEAIQDIPVSSSTKQKRARVDSTHLSTSNAAQSVSSLVVNSSDAAPPPQKRKRSRKADASANSNPPEGFPTGAGATQGKRGPLEDGLQGTAPVWTASVLPDRQRLAEWEASRAVQEIEDRQNTILNLSDMAKYSVQNIEDQEMASEDDAELVEDDNTGLDHMNVDVPIPTSKPKAGSTRDELEALFHAFLLDKGIDVNTLKQHESGAARVAVASAPLRTKKRNESTAMAGLPRDWHSRVSALKAPTNVPSLVSESDTIGGLHDEDAIAKGPSTSRKSRLASAARQQALAHTSAIGRDQSRRNTEVIEVSSDDEPRGMHPHALLPTPKPKPVKRAHQVKVEAASDVVPPSSSAPAAPVSSPNNAQPEVIRLHWKSVVVPVLYAYLFESKAPFGLNSDIKVVPRLNALLSQAFPSDTIIVRWKDETFTQAVARWGEKRSAVKAAAEAMVDRLFNKAPYKDDPDEIKKYALWAAHPRGPAICKVPIPQGCQGPEDEGYVKPSGIFESEHFIEVIKPFLTAYLGTPRIKLGRPCGLVGLVAAAIERAFSHYTELDDEDNKISSGQFTKGDYDDIVYDYADNAGRLTENRWNIIYGLCGFKGKQKTVKSIRTDPNLARQRRELYQPSSP
ncbi:hypothetical protein FB107DRAFT_246816 [Schizophyllum commune]